MAATQTSRWNSIQEIYNFLIKCESATYEQNCNIIDTQEMICLVLSKLPGNLREKWNRTVLNIRTRHLREPDFADLIHIVDDEGTLANDPLFSKDALSGYVDRKEAPSKQKQLKTYLLTANEKSGKSNQRFAISVKMIKTWINVKSI